MPPTISTRNFYRLRRTQVYLTLSAEFIYNR